MGTNNAAEIDCYHCAGLFTQLLFGSVMSLVSVFPPEYTGAVMTGNGVAGVLVGITSIATTLLFSSEDGAQLRYAWTRSARRTIGK